MGGEIISESGGGIIPLQGGRHYPGIGGGFLRNQHVGARVALRRRLAGAAGPLFPPRSHPLSVIQRFHVLCDRSQIRLGCYNLEVAARNSPATQFAHFDDDVPTHEAAELGKKAPITTGEQSPEPFLGCHILSSRSARHILARRYKKRRWLWTE